MATNSSATNKRKVIVYYYSFLQHNCLILSGFKELERERKINLKIICSYGNERMDLLPFPEIIEAEIDGLIVAFDMLDGYGFDFEKVSSYLLNVDYYFKRSFSDNQNKRFSPYVRNKIYPISLNWNVSFFLNPLEWKNTNYIKTLMRKIVFRNDISYYEKRSKIKKNTILFMCRLWDEKGTEIKNSEDLALERKQINETRINIIRTLKRKYGSYFTGGVEDSEVSRELCPDLILSRKITNRRNYMRIMRESAICIATTGLHQSIGWKFAEYVASGKAIVSEPLKYDVIGDLKSGENYLTFSTTKECINAVDKLLLNAELYDSMCKANQTYYYNYQRPDKQMEYVLDIVKKS